MVPASGGWGEWVVGLDGLGGRRLSLWYDQSGNLISLREIAYDIADFGMWGKIACLPDSAYANSSWN